LIKVDGTKIAYPEELPIQPSQNQIVYDAKKTSSKAWIWDIAIDKVKNIFSNIFTMGILIFCQQSGHPVIVYVRFPNDLDHIYHYARWNGNKWIDKVIFKCQGKLLEIKHSLFLY